MLNSPYDLITTSNNISFLIKRFNHKPVSIQSHRELARVVLQEGEHLVILFIGHHDLIVQLYEAQWNGFLLSFSDCIVILPLAFYLHLNQINQSGRSFL
jgi:hypothetical protein